MGHLFWALVTLQKQSWQKKMSPQVVEVFNLISSMQIEQLIFNCFFVDLTYTSLSSSLSPILDNLLKI
jgi:hypothetical protein